MVGREHPHPNAADPRSERSARRKKGNHQAIPLLSASNYDAWAILEEQRLATGAEVGRIFPCNGRSVGTAFLRVCRKLKIEDLHLHDLRHEGTSRLFEAGFSIEHVSLVTVSQPTSRGKEADAAPLFREKRSFEGDLLTS
ncbi:hypothetical protein [Propylenella binzhouense]|uniref:hypothetical protein n=1 Tax=Propylenella binzhouense TaxID=2555902 RepID=UPI001967E651|nr:hypothetical protein [Propylenella binzhouense]